MSRRAGRPIGKRVRRVAVSRRDGVRNVAHEVADARHEALPVANPDDRGNNAAGADRVTKLLDAPLTAVGAVEVAFLRSPQVLDAAARLGLYQAGIGAASRIANPTFSGSLVAGPGERVFMAGISQPIIDLLMLSARQRLASGDYARTQHLVAASLLHLVRDTEAGWCRYVSAEQVKALRAAVGRTAEVAAVLVQRFFDAENVSELDMTLLPADSSRARPASRRAATDARRAAEEDARTDRPCLAVCRRAPRRQSDRRAATASHSQPFVNPARLSPVMTYGQARISRQRKSDR